MRRPLVTCRRPGAARAAGRRAAADNNPAAGHNNQRAAPDNNRAAGGNNPAVVGNNRAAAGNNPAVGNSLAPRRCRSNRSRSTRRQPKHCERPRQTPADPRNRALFFANKIWRQQGNKARRLRQFTRCACRRRFREHLWTINGETGHRSRFQGQELMDASDEARPAQWPYEQGDARHSARPPFVVGSFARPDKMASTTGDRRWTFCE
jgi:hypothetical protein